MTCPKCGFDGSEIVEERPFVHSQMKVELRHVQDKHVGDRIWGKKQKELKESEKLPKKYSQEYETTGSFLEDFAETTGFEEVMN